MGGIKVCRLRPVCRPADVCTHYGQGFCTKFRFIDSSLTILFDIYPSFRGPVKDFVLNSDL